MRRRYLIHQARALAERYGLEREIEAVVSAAGCAAITGLGLAELDALVSHLERSGERIDFTCDRDDKPPAR